MDNTNVRLKRAVHTFLMQTCGSISKPPEIAKEEFYGVCTDSSVCVSNIFGVRCCEMIWLWMELREGKICSVHSWNTYCAELRSPLQNAEPRPRSGEDPEPGERLTASTSAQPQGKSPWDVCIHHAYFMFRLIPEDCECFQ